MSKKTKEAVQIDAEFEQMKDDTTYQVEAETLSAVPKVDEQVSPHEEIDTMSHLSDIYEMLDGISDRLKTLEGRIERYNQKASHKL